MDTLYFYASKSIWVLVSPESLYFLLCIATVCSVLLQWKKLSRNLAWLLLTVTLINGVLPVGEWLLLPLEQKFSNQPPLAPDSEIDGIIVLGGSFSLATSYHWQQVETKASSERLFSFIEYAHRYPNAQLIFSGGSSLVRRSEIDYTESQLAKQLFDSLGIDTSRIIFEDQSRNTRENARNTKALINPDIDEKWLLITSSYHMPRAIGVFCRAGWHPIPVAIDHQTLKGDVFRLNWDFFGNSRKLEWAVREWLGLISHRLLGYTDQLIPSGCTQPND